MTNNVLHGFYSLQADLQFGHCTYLNDRGAKVKVTCVGSNPSGEGYNWADKVYMGVVTKYVDGTISLRENHRFGGFKTPIYSRL